MCIRDSRQREVFSMHFKLRDEYIKLEQLLKACDVVSSGGQVKEYLANVEMCIRDRNIDCKSMMLRTDFFKNI